MNIISREETTIDYPGKFGQILFCPGCNFKCGFCQNPDLINPSKESVDLDLLLKDLENWTKSGWYQSVVISGGEPTLQQDLPEFAKKLKQLGLLVKIDTNGNIPEMLQILLQEGNVDYIAMDIKASKEKYVAICGVDVNLDNIDKSIELAKKFPDYEFRTTVLPFFKKEDFEKMGGWISKNGQEKIKLWTLQQFNAEKTLDPKYRKLIPKSKEELQELGKIAEKYAEKVRVLD